MLIDTIVSVSVYTSSIYLKTPVYMFILPTEFYDRER
jgi:hypothetical protein